MSSLLKYNDRVKSVSVSVCVYSIGVIVKQYRVVCLIGNRYNTSTTSSLMIYTSIILLTVLEIFSLNEWENISLFLTNFLCLEEFAGVIVLLVVTSPLPADNSDNILEQWVSPLTPWQSHWLGQLSHLDSDDGLGLFMEDCLEGRGDLHREVHRVGEDVRVKHVGGLPRPDHQQSVMSSGPARR